MTASSRNLVLTGFMGTGKSAVGQGAARLLGRSFVDMDELIAQRWGMSIPEVFRRRGEHAFRQSERTLCEELSTQERLVIATGGGALVEPGNREAMGRNGCLICLDCEEDELLARIGGDAGRPMLDSEDPEQRLSDLLRSRARAYAEIPHHFDTTAKPLDRVVRQVVELFRSEPRAWRIATPTGTYQVHLVPGGLAHLGPLLRIRGVAGNLVVVSDENVWPLYGDQVLASLQESGYRAAPIVLPAGEEHKTLDTVRTLYDHFAGSGLDRGAAVVALGGGVITDMAGFAAASFMRGIPLVQAPTTLLGMVDASIGGKVAVDHPKGKNLIGAFVRPLLVMVDPNTLDTLPELERRAGLAEVIKHGVIADPDLFESLEQGAPERDLRWIIERAVRVKIDVVEKDPYERGRRAVLNLGHTFAHAFEVLAGYRLKHGLAVGMGMAAATHLAQIRGLCSPQAGQRIRDALRSNSLPTTYEACPPEEVYHAMRTDKKRRGASLRFVLPRDIGDVIIDADVPRGQVISALERMRP